MKLHISGAWWFCVLLLALPAWGQEAARMAPADTGVFIEVQNLAQHRAAWEADPVAQVFRDNFPKRSCLEWEAVQEAMGMTASEIIDRYFGRTVALIGRQPGPHQPVILLSRIAPEDGKIARERLKLVDAGPVGDFATFLTEDGKAKFAFRGEWMAITGVEHDAFFRTVLEQGNDGASLADDETFQAWTAKLPANRTATAFARKEHGEVHALAVVKPDRNMTVHYVGTSREYKKIGAKLGSGRQFDFGPLPRATIAAMSLNLYDPNPAAGRGDAFIDQLLAPKTLRGDVIPALEAPVVMFLGEVPGQQLEPDPGFAVPVVGLAMKLRDPAVAQDLDRALHNAVMMLGVLAASQPEPLPALASQAMTQADATFHVANIGELMAVRSGRPELKSLNLAYGRIGDWYVVCTQEMFFRQAISAQAGDFLPVDTATGQTPVARMHLKPIALGTHLIGLAQFLHDSVPDRLDDEKLNRIKALGQAMTFYESLDMTIHRDADETMVGKLEIIRD